MYAVIGKAIGDAHKIEIHAAGKIHVSMLQQADGVLSAKIHVI